MRRGDSANTAGLGVTYTRLAFEEALGWVFREQPTEDYGIDAQAEVVEDGDVTGQLLAIQIKSGESWFREPAPSGWWFRPDAAHVRYWTRHTLPVIVVLFDPASKGCYWQLVRQDLLIATSAGGWKLLIPRDQPLDVTAALPLHKRIWNHHMEQLAASLRSRHTRLVTSHQNTVVTPPAKASAPALNPKAGSVVDGRLYLNVPFGEKNEARQCGARWNAQVKMWHINAAAASQDQLRRWLPSTT